MESKFKSSNQREAILDAIFFAQAMPTEKSFKKAMEFITQQFEFDESEKEILSYYRDKVNKWAEAFSPLMPSTNNGLESTNAAIKQSKTLRERLPINVYLGKCTELLRSWSLKRKSTSINYLCFSMVPNISNNTWTSAYHIAVNKDYKFLSPQKDVTLII